MKNNFNIEVSFDKLPQKPYNWTSKTYINNIKVKRVSSKLLRDILTNNCIIKTNKHTLLLSDTRCTIAIRLDKKGYIISRSFLNYSADEKISEYASNLKINNIEYSKIDELVYEETNENKEISNKITNIIKGMKNNYKIKYLYYLYFNNIDNYSKERLIEEINNNPSENIYKIYDFLNKIKN